MIPNLTNQDACKLALKHRLYVPGWMLIFKLKNGAKNDDGVRLAAVYQEADVPVGVAVVTNYGDIQVFVRKSMRRKGIGSKLIAHMRTKLTAKENSQMDAGTGLKKGSSQFWRANDVRMYD